MDRITTVKWCAALAALVLGGVVSFDIGKCNATNPGRASTNHSVVRNSADSENVLIGYLPHDINRGTPICHAIIKIASKLTAETVPNFEVAIRSQWKGRKRDLLISFWGLLCERVSSPCNHNPLLNIVSWGLPGILDFYVDFGFGPQGQINDGSLGDHDIGTQLTFCGIRGGLGKCAHGGGGFSRFGYMRHSSSHRLLPVADGLSGNIPHSPSDPPQGASHKGEKPRKPNYPPVWTRIPLALALGLGANPVMMWGCILSDRRDRAGLGGTLRILALLMFLGGGGLMMALAFPATWGWWF